MVDLETLLTYLTLISIPIGIFYYIMTLENTRKNQQMQLETRQAQLFMQIYSAWSSREAINTAKELNDWTWTDYDDFIQKYGETNNLEAGISFAELARRFEGIGVLIKRKLIDPYFVDDLMSGNILWSWETFGSIVRERRVRENSPAYMEYWEYLYEEVSAIAHKQHPELAT